LRQLDKQQNPSQDERASLELQIATKNAWKNQLKASLKTMQDAKTAKVKQLTGFASARKTEEDSLVTGIDNIYQEFNIFRAQYHGGDMAGGHLSLLMDNAVEIMKKVEDCLLQAFFDSQNHNTSLENTNAATIANADATTPPNANATAESNTNATAESNTNAIQLNANPTPVLNSNVTNLTCPSTTTEDEIRLACKNVTTYLLLWDNFLSLVHMEYPTSVDCDKAQEYIDEIVKLADSMGISRSIKMHVCKDHLVSQMRRFECGLSDCDENFMEKYHQSGAKLDKMYKSVSNETQADARAARLRLTENVRTQAAGQRVSEKFTRKRGENHEANETLKRLRKSEKREQQLQQIQSSESIIPINNGPLITADDGAGLPSDVAVPDDEEDGRTGAL
jgi:hypothetical protein